MDQAEDLFAQREKNENNELHLVAGVLHVQLEDGGVASEEEYIPARLLRVLVRLLGQRFVNSSAALTLVGRA